jgi:purine-binding chemotaxis protein CheW
MTTKCNRIDWDAVRERLARFQSPGGDYGSQNGERRNKVFRERAERLARRGRQDAAQTARVPVVVIRVGSERYGIELSDVKQVFSRVPITHVPAMGGLLLGVANLNGTLRSVIDLGVLLRVTTKRSDAGYVLLLRASGKMLGVWVEAFEDVCQIDLDALEAMDEVATNPVGGFMRGMTNDRIAVLNTELFLDHVAERCKLDAAKTR